MGLYASLTERDGRPVRIAGTRIKKTGQGRDKKYIAKTIDSLSPLVKNTGYDTMIAPNYLAPKVLTGDKDVWEEFHPQLDAPWPFAFDRRIYAPDDRCK